jgi:hypothetical protein
MFKKVRELIKSLKSLNNFSESNHRKLQLKLGEAVINYNNKKKYRRYKSKELELATRVVLLIEDTSYITGLKVNKINSLYTKDILDIDLLTNIVCYLPHASSPRSLVKLLEGSNVSKREVSAYMLKLMRGLDKKNLEKVECTKRVVVDDLSLAKRILNLISSKEGRDIQHEAKSLIERGADRKVALYLVSNITDEYLAILLSYVYKERPEISTENFNELCEDLVNCIDN